jgi:membrane protein YqaA with SNARE-associated domain
MRRLYRRILALAASPHAPWSLAALAFAEASVFPIPPDALLIPLCLARPRAAFRFAAIATLASVAGGALGYVIGYALFDWLATPILRLYHLEPAFARFRAAYAHWGLWLILIKGLTPIPYKVVTIASGAARFDFPLFMGASLLTRGARFFAVALILRHFGDGARDFIDRRLGLVTGALALGIVFGFALLRFLPG